MSTVPRTYSTKSPILSTKASYSTDYDTLVTLSPQKSKQFLKLSSVPLDKKIIDSISLLFLFKEIIKMILEKNICRTVCNEIPCLIKEVLRDLARYSKVSRNTTQTITCFNLIEAFSQKYASDAVIDSIFDVFQIFINSFINSSCYNNDKLLFTMRVKNEFACVCGKKSKAFTTSLTSIAVQIHSNFDFIVDPLHKIAKKQLADAVFTTCTNPICVHKKSKRLIDFENPPILFVFKMIWNQDIDSKNYIISSIQTEFNLNEFSTKFKGVYKLSLIFLQYDYFYQENGFWVGKNLKSKSWNQLTLELTSSQDKILALIYISSIEFSHSASNTLTSEQLSPTPQTLTGNTKPSIEKCRYCNAPSLSLCKCPKYNCNKCGKEIKSDSKYCVECLGLYDGKIKDTKYSTFTRHKCVSCQKIISDPGLCADCKLIKTDSKKLIKTNNNFFTSYFCKTCSKEIHSGYCISCKTLVTNGKCSTCSGIRGLECEGCRNKEKQRRPASNFNTRYKCYECGNFISRNGMYCSKCSRPSAGPCIHCNIAAAKMICIKCNSKSQRFSRLA